MIPEQPPARTVTVSVVVPVYNREGLIVGTLESLLSQRFEAFEVIVVDDGSTDGTAEVVRAFAARDPRIRYLFQDNAGPGAARNTGIGAARAEWIAFLDSDDLWEPDKLSNFRSLLDGNPQLDFVHTNWRALHRDGRKGRPRDMANFEALSHKIHLLKTYSLRTSTVLIRRDLLDRLGGYFYTDSPLYEDFHLFWRAVAEAKAVGYIPSCDTIGVLSEGSLARDLTPERNGRAKILALDRMRRWTEGRAVPPEYGAIFRDRIYREFQALFRVLIGKRKLSAIGREFLSCSRLLSPARAVRALVSSAVDEMR